MGLLGSAVLGVLLAHFLNNAGYVPYAVARVHYRCYVVREGVNVVNRLGVKLPSDLLNEALRIVEITSSNCSSMLRDTSVNYVLWLLASVSEGNFL